jgi:hypothetical protein
MTKPGFANKQRGDVFEYLIVENIVPCCSVVVRKSLLDEVGGFDEDRALMGVDDWYLWIKLSLVCEFDFVPEHLAVHVFHGDNYSLNDKYMHDAELLCISKLRLHKEISQKDINWAQILSSLNIRYAKSYLNSGEFRLAGRTFLEASRKDFSLKTLLLGVSLTLTPVSILRFFQARKRKMAGRDWSA